MKKQEDNGSKESVFFHKNANPNAPVEPRWDYPEIDLWLIEIWPLVEQYGWRYNEVCDLAFDKFGGDDAMVHFKVLNDSKVLKERCQEQLGLRLSPLAQQRKGKPKDRGVKTVVQWFGDEVYPKCLEHAEAPDPEVDLRGAPAFQRLAEMAVNLEPFTRLLNNSSKETFPVAVPSLKMRGKKLGTSPPFFVAPMS